MTKEKQAKLCRIGGLIFALLTVLVGVLLIVQTWSIYRSAPNSPYTPQNIAKHFKEIAPAVLLWAVALIGIIALQIAFPQDEPRPKAYVDVKTTLQRMEKRLPIDELSLAEGKEIAKKGESTRKIATYLAVIFSVLALGVTFAILLDWFYVDILKWEFFAAHDGAVDRLVQGFVLSVLSLTVVSVCLEWIERSRKTQQKAYVELIKKAKAEGRKGETTLHTEKAPNVFQKLQAKIQGWFGGEKKEKAVLVTRIVLATLAVVLIGIGIWNGGMKDVLAKAVNICTQCIGLG